MKRLIALLLCLLTLLALTACAAEPAETTAPTETEATEPVDTYDYPEIADKLSWEKINSFPIKTSVMTVEEMRKLCVDFFRFTKTFLWTPDSNFKFIKTQAGAVDEITQGTVYGGLPYIGAGGCGNVYRIMDYYNTETGVVSVREAAVLPGLFGGHCSGTAYWAWGRVINSFDYGYTADLTPVNGFLTLGPYTCSQDAEQYDIVTGTDEICARNGEQVMFQSYALLQPADGLVKYNNAGHVVMCSSAAHVEYVEGTDQIDPEKSYITIIEQGSVWKETTNAGGETFQMKNSVDAKWTFRHLFESNYIPFTFAEFLGTDPVEETVCEFSFTGDTITVKELFAGKVTANYGISDIYAIVRDAAGKEIYRHAVRAKIGGTEELNLDRNMDNVCKWGKLDVSSGDFTVEIVVQLSTGERPTIYTGRLVP